MLLSSRSAPPAIEIDRGLPQDRPVTSGASARTEPTPPARPRRRRLLRLLLARRRAFVSASARAGTARVLGRRTPPGAAVLARAHGGARHGALQPRRRACRHGERRPHGPASGTWHRPARLAVLRFGAGKAGVHLDTPSGGPRSQPAGHTPPSCGAATPPGLPPIRRLPLATLAVRGGEMTAARQFSPPTGSCFVTRDAVPDRRRYGTSDAAAASCTSYGGHEPTAIPGLRACRPDVRCRIQPGREAARDRRATTGARLRDVATWRTLRVFALSGRRDPHHGDVQPARTRDSRPPGGSTGRCGCGTWTADGFSGRCAGRRCPPPMRPARRSAPTRRCS